MPGKREPVHLEGEARNQAGPGDRGRRAGTTVLSGEEGGRGRSKAMKQLVFMALYSSELQCERQCGLRISPRRAGILRRALLRQRVLCIHQTR